MQESSKKFKRNRIQKMGTKGKSPKQDLTSSKDLTIKLSEWCESPYHRVN